ncbi:MAG: hypothetical protein J6I73_02075 [Treponema sp.]|nr:hypothetical protein [Treponema sp.]
MQATRSSFTGMLDDIDYFIVQGMNNDALTELKKAEKYTYDSWSRIGIYRRYMQLGESKRAEDVLKKGLKKNPKNPEMSAVYAQFLMRSGKHTDALNVAECLQGTRFGSLYAEAYFANLGGAVSLFNEAHFQIFYDAYVGSHDLYWLRNCALICVKDGDYERAALLQPVACWEPEDAYFWSLVMFDARQFSAAAAYAEKARELYPVSSVRSRHLVSLIEIVSLLSDSYVALSETDAAERVRHELLARLEENTAGFNMADETVQVLLPVLYVDSALFAEASGDDNECARLLTHAVDTWPDYVPALVAYADFAYRTSLPSNEDMRERTLRDAGIATLKMEAYDASAKIPVSDAAWRMDRSLERHNNPQLYIARLNLKYAMDSSLTKEEKIADVWNELEKSAIGTNVYPPEIFEYALNTLLTYGGADDAERIFRKYVAAKYDYSALHDFWQETAAHVRDFTVREAEYAAWFAAHNRRADTAVRLYEYCVYESGGGAGDSKTISALVSTPSCINLAMIYRSLGMTAQSLDLYAAAAMRAASASHKAEIHYRMALIYAAQNKKQEALRSCGYALALRPAFARAKLLRDKLLEH